MSVVNLEIPTITQIMAGRKPPIPRAGLSEEGFVAPTIYFIEVQLRQKTAPSLSTWMLFYHLIWVWYVSSSERSGWLGRWVKTGGGLAVDCHMLLV